MATAKENSTQEALSRRSLFVQFQLLRASRRLLVSIVVALIAAALIHGRGWEVRAVAAWDAGATMMLSLTWWIILISNPRQTRRRAAAQDPGRTATWVIVCASSGFSLFAAAGLLRHARHVEPSRALLLSLLCLWAVVVSWLLTHTAYALRYAHLYYRQDADGEGGLSFPEPPDDWDFAYFSFTLGMCFQVSDVSVQSRTIRRAVLIHAMLSFAYNTVILSLALNIAFGLLG